MIKSIFKSTLISTVVVFALLLLLLKGQLMFIQAVVCFIVVFSASFIFISSIYDGTVKVAAKYHKMRASASVLDIDPNNIVIEVSDKGSNVKERR